MWFAAIGAAFGFLQYILLSKIVNILLSEKSRTFLSVFISIGKLALILVFLWIVAAAAGIESMIWCALGMLTMMVFLPIIKGIQNIKKYNKQPVQEKK